MLRQRTRPIFRRPRRRLPRLRPLVLTTLLALALPAQAQAPAPQRAGGILTESPSPLVTVRGG